MKEFPSIPTLHLYYYTLYSNWIDMRRKKIESGCLKVKTDMTEQSLSTVFACYNRQVTKIVPVLEKTIDNTCVFPIIFAVLFTSSNNAAGLNTSQTLINLRLIKMLLSVALGLVNLLW